MKLYPLIILIMFCALRSGAQNLSSGYIALADSADRYIRDERWADAERVIVTALRKEPANKSNYLLWANLGIVRANLEDHRGALQAYNIGLASAPRSTILLTNRAYSLTALGMPEEAIRDLDTALGVDSTLVRSRKMRGLLLGSVGDRERAIRDFDIYEKANGEDASIQEARGDLTVTEGKPDEALPYYRNARRLNPDEPTTVKMLKCAFMAGRIESAEEELGEAIRKFPRNGDLYLLRAALNKLRYQTSAMESDLTTARSLGADRTLTAIITSDRKGK